MNIPSPFLLVAPPMQHPAFFPPAFRRAATVLRGMGAVYGFHAGADMLAYLMRPDVLEQLVSRARQQVQLGRLAAVDSATAIQAAAYTQEPHVCQTLLKECAETAQTLQTDAFFDPLKAALALQRIDQALTLMSLAYSPSMIDRRGFSHPDLCDEADLVKWAADAERNPFLAYVHDGCRPPVAPAQCASIVFVVDTPGQLPGALTMAQVWRRSAPQADIRFWAADGRLRARAERLTADLALGPAQPEPAWMQQVRLAAEAPDAGTDNLSGMGSLLLPGRPGESSNDPLIFCGRLQSGALRSALDRPNLQNGVLIWHDPEGETAQLTALLYQAAKKGIWNHVVLPDRPEQPLIAELARFAAQNPNIIHSWCRRTEPASAFSDPRDIFPEGNPPYGSTRLLPGSPLWQWLQDPIYLNAYAVRHGVKALARMYLMPDARSVHEAGSRMIFRFVPPEQLPPGYLEEIVRMVEAGGSVQTQYVRYNLERAYLIGYVEENGIIIGNSSLKHPRQEYIEAVGRQTGIDLTNYLERGYTSVRPEYRSLGVGAKLLEGLTERVEGYKVYSIIAEDNVATQKMAIRNRTRKVATFYSERSGKTISVWIPEGMLPDGIELPQQPDLG